MLRYTGIEIESGMKGHKIFWKMKVKKITRKRFNISKKFFSYKCEIQNRDKAERNKKIHMYMKNVATRSILIHNIISVIHITEQSSILDFEELLLISKK